MSFKFIKVPTTNNPYPYNRDHESIEVQTTDTDATISDLCELFRHFLLACGYSPTAVDRYFGDEE